MIRKTALLAGVAGAMLFAVPAMAQDTPPQSPSSITVQPGAVVTGAGGVELGRLEGVQTNASGQQELQVRGADGQIRAVPLEGLQQSGEGLSVSSTQAEFQAAPTVEADDADETPTAPATTEATPAPDAEPVAPTEPAAAPDPSMQAMPSEDATPPAAPPADETTTEEVPTAPPPTLPEAAPTTQDATPPADAGEPTPPAEDSPQG